MNAQTMDVLKVHADQLVQVVQDAWIQHLQQADRHCEPAAVYASMRRRCVRAMALDLIAWDQKPPREPEALERMRRGKEREDAIVARLLHVGQLATPPFHVIHEQYGETLKDRTGRVIIRMRIDGRIEFDGNGRLKPPFEIKRYDPNVAEGIATVEDFAKYWWTRHAVDQMLMYLLAHNEPWGLFVLETRGLPRLIPIFLEEHLERAESFLRDAERAMDAKELYPALGPEALPPFIQDAAECRRCPHFGRSCNPPLHFDEGVQVIEDAELETLLKRRDELSPDAAEYRRLDKAIKDRFKGIPLAIVGDFQITGREVARKGYAVKDGTHWELEIERLTPANGSHP